MRADNLYATEGMPERFSFDESVSNVFADMIRRSVPGYAQMLAMTAQIARLQANKLKRPITVYDLGCSLGAVGHALLQVFEPHEIRLIAVDNSAPMLTQARALFERFEHPVECVHADICELDFERCDLVISNLTLQFVDPKSRDDLIARIYDALTPGGQLIVSEKVSSGSADPWLIEVHEQFKRANGYSETEIAKKREALEGVLIRDSLAQHHDRFKAAGFSESHTWFQYLNFVALCAMKNDTQNSLSPESATQAPANPDINTNPDTNTRATS